MALLYLRAPPFLAFALKMTEMGSWKGTNYKMPMPSYLPFLPCFLKEWLKLFVTSTRYVEQQVSFQNHYELITSRFYFEGWKKMHTFDLDHLLVTTNIELPASCNMHALIWYFQARPFLSPCFSQYVEKKKRWNPVIVSFLSA